MSPVGWLVAKTNSSPPVEVGLGVSVGRKEACRIQIRGATVSAVQCEVRWNSEQQRYELTDRSSNGTFLNGQAVTQPCGRLAKHSLEGMDL